MLPRGGIRKPFAVVVVILLLLNTSLVSTEQPISVVVNGRPLVMDVSPIIRSGRTLVPLRAIFEALGASVEWNDATRTITGKRAETMITLQIDNRGSVNCSHHPQQDVGAPRCRDTEFNPYVSEPLG